MTTDSFHGHQEHPQPYSIMNLLPSSGATTIVQLPLAFVRSGYIYLYHGLLRLIGENGYGWSHTAKSSTNAYYLGMTPADINPSYDNDRWYGFPLH